MIELAIVPEVQHQACVHELPDVKVLPPVTVHPLTLVETVIAPAAELSKSSLLHDDCEK